MDGITTYDVSVWKIATARNRRRKHGVRWRTAGQEHSEWFATKALADSFRTDLIRAQRAGERFDVESGLPTSVLAKRSERSLLEVAESYVDHLWSVGAPPNTRRAAVMHLSAAVPCSFGNSTTGRPGPSSDACCRLACCHHRPEPRRSRRRRTLRRPGSVAPPGRWASWWRPTRWLTFWPRSAPRRRQAGRVGDLGHASGRSFIARSRTPSSGDARCQSGHGPQADLAGERVRSIRES